MTKHHWDRPKLLITPLWAAKAVIKADYSVNYSFPEWGPTEIGL